jgi:hypothetical protein
MTTPTITTNTNVLKQTSTTSNLPPIQSPLAISMHSLHNRTHGLSGNHSHSSPQHNNHNATTTNTSSITFNSLGNSVHTPFFQNRATVENVPQWLQTHYQLHSNELAIYDAWMKKKVKEFSDKINNVDVIIGIPFYTEITNIISVIITLKEVFQQRKQRACIMIVGEQTQAQMVQLIKPHHLEDAPEDYELDVDNNNRNSSSIIYTSIVTFWKPEPKYASKPFSVRALQIAAASANRGNGAHLVIMDADIQFNHWELSAMSLMRALLDPLMAMPAKDEPSSPTTDLTHNDLKHNSQFPLSALEQPPAASFVLLNAPRSFISDDALIHLFSYLMTYCYTGEHIHQSHGGEFSIHRQLNKDLLVDTSIVYRRCYCVEAQLVVRALLEEGPAPPITNPTRYGGHVLEILLKGKWHAKINLNKLLQLDDRGNARIDLVTERLFDEAVLHSAIRSVKTTNPVHGITGGLTRTPNPDPNQQSLNVLCPVATKRELLEMIQAYYTVLLAAQSDNSLPIDSLVVSELVPLLHRFFSTSLTSDSWKLIRSSPPTIEDSRVLVFGPEDWAKHTMELINIYSKDFKPPNSGNTSPTPESTSAGARRRHAIVCANRVVWLVGALAFLNDLAQSDCNWGDMHELVHSKYGPVFRRTYLMDVLKMDQSEIDEVLTPRKMDNH